jgi:hypothetical protein
MMWTAAEASVATTWDKKNIRTGCLLFLKNLFMKSQKKNKYVQTQNTPKPP